MGKKVIKSSMVIKKKKKKAAGIYPMKIWKCGSNRSEKKMGNI